MGLSDIFRAPFSFFNAGKSQDERLANYVLREHERGRPLADILEDPYVRNRTSPEARNRILDRPEVVHALGESAIADARALLSSGR